MVMAVVSLVSARRKIVSPTTKASKLRNKNKALALDGLSLLHTHTLLSTSGKGRWKRHISPVVVVVAVVRVHSNHQSWGHMYVQLFLVGSAGFICVVKSCVCCWCAVACASQGRFVGLQEQCWGLGREDSCYPCMFHVYFVPLGLVPIVIGRDECL